MPAVSKAQHRFLEYKKGHAWMKKHGFDNKTAGLPEHVKKPKKKSKSEAHHAYYGG